MWIDQFGCLYLLRFAIWNGKRPGSVFLQITTNLATQHYKQNEQKFLVFENPSMYATLEN